MIRSKRNDNQLGILKTGRRRGILAQSVDRLLYIIHLREVYRIRG
jgi:hypothetical protein